MKIQKAKKIGFCFGVRRAIAILEKVARERSGVETLGAVVHNRQVLDRLAGLGVRIVRDVADVKGDTVITSSHGVSPQLEKELKDRHIRIVSTTCPFVHRAQVAARRLADSGFLVVIYGEDDHPEVRGILGWAKGKGVATEDSGFMASLNPRPRRLGLLAQTTQIPGHFTGFVKECLDSALAKDSELRIIDTICHDIRERQSSALELAGKVDLMLVVGGRNSANTNRLAELCATAATTYLVETAADIQPAWLTGQNDIGVAAGASTAEWTIDEVVARLEALSQE